MSNTTPVKTVAEFAAEYLSKGIEIGAAYQQAAKDYESQAAALHAIENAKIVADAAAAAASTAGLVNFLDSGLWLKGLKPGMVSPSQSKSCTACNSGALIEPANYDAAGRTFFPPKLWVLTEGKSPWFLNQSEASQLLDAENREPGSVLRLLTAIGSAEKVKEYADEKKRLTDAKLIKTYDSKTKSWV